MHGSGGGVEGASAASKKVRAAWGSPQRAPVPCNVRRRMSAVEPQEKLGGDLVGNRAKENGLGSAREAARNGQRLQHQARLDALAVRRDLGIGEADEGHRAQAELAEPAGPGGSRAHRGVRKSLEPGLWDGRVELASRVAGNAPGRTETSARESVEGLCSMSPKWEPEVANTSTAS